MGLQRANGGPHHEDDEAEVKDFRCPLPLGEGSGEDVARFGAHSASKGERVSNRAENGSCLRCELRSNQLSHSRPAVTAGLFFVNDSASNFGAIAPNTKSRPVRTLLKLISAGLNSIGSIR